MKHKQNLHIHTTYVDGKDSVEEIILDAIAKNFESIGFSEHSYTKFSTFPDQLTTPKMEAYRKEILKLKDKYSDKIDIFCGLEYEFTSDLDTTGFDYLIGSVHYLDCKGEIVTFDRGLQDILNYINKYFDGNSLNFAKKYFETVALLPTKKNFDILGHFDLIAKHNRTGNYIDTASKEYLDLGFDAIHSLKGKIPFFEVNTGAMSRGFQTSPYPQMEFLKEFKNCGFGALITSDCHDKTYLDGCYTEAEEYIKQAGFTTKWILSNDEFKEVKL